MEKANKPNKTKEKQVKPEDKGWNNASFSIKNYHRKTYEEKLIEEIMQDEAEEREKEYIQYIIDKQ